MEYFISTDLSNVGAIFNLHNWQYSLIEIDNDANATQVVFTVSHPLEITGSIEVSGNALDYIFFQAPNQSIALYNCSIKGANEIKVISNSLTIESVETLALSTNSQDIEANRLDVKNTFKIEGSTAARLSKILSGDLSIETKDLKTSDSITSTGNVDITASSSELSGRIVSLSNIKINSATSCEISGDILSSNTFGFQGSPLEISGSSASIKAPSINIESEGSILKDGAKLISADANLGTETVKSSGIRINGAFSSDKSSSVESASSILINGTSNLDGSIIGLADISVLGDSTSIQGQVNVPDVTIKVDDKLDIASTATFVATNFTLDRVKQFSFFGTIEASGKIDIYGLNCRNKQTFRLDGTIKASSIFIATCLSPLINLYATLQSIRIHILSTETVINFGQIDARGLYAGNFINENTVAAHFADFKSLHLKQGSKTDIKEDLRIKGEQLICEGHLQANEVKVVTNALTLSGNTTVTKLDATANTCNISGVIGADASVQLRCKDSDISGELLSSGNISLHSGGKAVITGRIQSASNVNFDLAKGDIQPTATISGQNFNLNANQSLTFSGKAEITNQTSVTLPSNVTLSGTIHSLGLTLISQSDQPINLAAQITAAKHLDLQGSFVNLATITAAAFSVSGIFFNGKVFSVKGFVAFAKSVYLRPYSITEVGYFQVGTNDAPAEIIECKGCSFKALDETATSNVYANTFAVEPESLVRGAVIVNSVSGYRVCNKNGIIWHTSEFRSILHCNLYWSRVNNRKHVYGKHVLCSISVTDPNCQPSQKSEFLMLGDLSLNIKTLHLSLSLLSVKGKLHFYKKPHLYISSLDCARTIETDCALIKFSSNFADVLKKYGIQSYRQIRENCAKEHGRWVGTYTFIDTTSEANFKSIIHAGKITGAVSGVELGISDGSAPSVPALTASASTALTVPQAYVMPLAQRADIANLKIQIVTNYGTSSITTTIDPLIFFATSGIDINLMMQTGHFASRVWNLEAVPSNALVPAGTTGYSLNYFVKLDANIVPNFDPKIFLRQVGFQATGIVHTTDGHYTERLVRDAVFITIGLISGLDQVHLINVLAFNGYNAWPKLNLVSGNALTSWQIAELDYPIIWPVWSINCGGVVARCLSYQLYFNKDSLNNFLYGNNIIADDGIDLSVDGNLLVGHISKIASKGGRINLNIGGHAVVVGSLELDSQESTMQVAGNFVSVGEIKSTADLAIRALNAAIAGELKAKGNLQLDAVQKLVVATLYSVAEIGSYNYYQRTTSILRQTTVQAGGTAALASGDDAFVIGARIVGSEVYLQSANGQVKIVPIELYQKTVAWGKRYYHEYQALTLHKSSIEALEPGTYDKSKGLARFSSDVAKYGGATGVFIQASGGILLDSTNVRSDKPIEFKAGADGVSILNSVEYTISYTKTSKKRGGFAGACGGKKTRTVAESFAQSVDTKIIAPIVKFFTQGMITIGADIVAHAVEFNRDGASRDALTKIISRFSSYSIEIRTEKSGWLFEKSDSGRFMFAGKKIKGESHKATEIIPTVIGLVQTLDSSQPQFIVSTPHGFQLVSGRIEEWEDETGKVVETSKRKSKIIIEAGDIELLSMPDMKSDLAFIDEKGFGFGCKVNSGEVSLSLGVVKHQVKKSSFSLKHNNFPTILGGLVQLNATNSIRDMAAIYDARQMDMHAKIIFHGVAEDLTVETVAKTLMEAGAKLGIKTGSLGRMIDSGKRYGEQDAERVDGWINAGFAALEIYHNALKFLGGKGGISGGAWAFAHYFHSESTTKTKTEIPTQMRAGELNITTDEWKLIGTRIEALRAYFKTKYLDTRPAEFSTTTTNEFQEFDGEIPLTSGAPGGFGVAFGKGRADTKLMMNAVIHIHEDLRLQVEGHADMRGISLSAKSLEAFFNSLLLESVQDLAKSEQWGAGFSLSSTDISSINGQVTKGERHVVREISSIFGTDRANIVVANALRLNAGMIAAAHRDENGAYTEHGKLTLSVGELFVQHIYDYDNGHTLGAAIASDAFAPTVGGHSASGTTFATIGKGDVSCTGAECQLNDANTDVTKSQTWEKDYDVQPIRAYIPTDMPTLPKTADGNVDWSKVEDNVKAQLQSTFDPFKHIFQSAPQADSESKSAFKEEQPTKQPTEHVEEQGDSETDIKIIQLQPEQAEGAPEGVKAIKTKPSVELFARDVVASGGLYQHSFTIFTFSDGSQIIITAFPEKNPIGMVIGNLKVVDEAYIKQRSELFGDDWKDQKVTYISISKQEFSTDKELNAKLFKARTVVRAIETGNNGGRFDYDLCFSDHCWGANSNTVQGAIHTAMGNKITVPKGIKLPGIKGKFYNGPLDDLLLKLGQELQKDD